MKLSAQEEYGLRCLLQVARQAPASRGEPVSIRDVAEAEGLSVDYAAKLLRVLRQAELVDSERGATGGYRLARALERISVAEVMRALDSPLYSGQFCEVHTGQREACVHDSGCSMRRLWQKVEEAVGQVLSGVSLADLLADRGDPAATGAARGADVAAPNEPQDPTSEGGQPWHAR